MEFFDCNVWYGAETATDTFRPAHSIPQLQDELTRAGVTRAVVSRVNQMAGGAISANEQLAEELQGAQNLYGVWVILPSHTHELPEPDAFAQQMKANHILGWRLCPTRARFLPRVSVLRDWLDVAVARNIPLFIDTAHGTTLEQTADLLEAYPHLTVVLTYTSTWPSDRFLRPFVAEFPNVYLDLTHMITAGGIESFVGEYGASRLLYGSGFPECYFGGNMLMVRHAAIPEADRIAVAGGNLQRIVAEVLHD